jgi:hypothetical protein
MLKPLTLILMAAPYQWPMLVFLADIIPLLQCILFSVFNVRLSKHTSSANDVLSLQQNGQSTDPCLRLSIDAQLAWSL